MVSNLISIPVSIPGYYITEELYNGSRTLVFRGYRETDSLRVVIKLLKNPYPSFSELVQFRNQYTIAKNLNLKGIIHTYSLEPYKNSYILVMEDFGGISLKDYFANNNNVASLDEFLQIAISLCDILDILYRQRIIHKDIKPSNILINPETKQVKLIDFSIASLLPREIQTLISPNVLEGTLAYISPEQTGRMNRGIDYRTDFYSLGVTFYELLTGKLPFESNEPMELVHCHIAKQGPALVDSKEIPQVISDIVIKLMAKNAEDRYQSALGLKHDLEKCLYHIQETGKVGNFEIGKRDICDSFIIPDKLYGRETEVETLFQAFERISTGTTEMMLVAGFSGIGKTAVVNEVHKPIVRQRGYFIKGKFDQFNRNIPFSAFVQAFRDLMGQLLTESDAKIQQWKTKILEVVGENGQVIVEVIPELERIIGTQAPAQELSGTTAQNRFNLLFQKFTQVLTSKEHPLVMFLDDLQWADSASLKLMQLLMADTGYLFLIGAYRDNEVNLAHPLMLTLSEIEKTAATINTITLAPLNLDKVNKLVAQTLKCAENLALPLSKLVEKKTQGNPFFATQFLKALHQDGLIKFDFDLGCWQCDIAAVTQRVFTSDVVEFMALQLQKLPKSTQEVLKLAACIGNQFDLQTLAIVCELSEVETATNLWAALQSDLILPQSEVYKFYQDSYEHNQISDRSARRGHRQTAKYKFLHDRVQQATYSLIPQDQKQSTHYRIGNLLLENLSEIDRENQLFEIVHHLNIGSSLIVSPSKREELAQLNLATGNKARISTAYKAASNYFVAGIDLLAIGYWEKQYQLSLKLFLGRAEVETLAGHFELASSLIETVIEQTDSLLDKCAAYELKMRINTASGQPQTSIDTALVALNLLHIPLESEPPSSVDFEQLLNLPEMSNPAKLKAMEILMSVIGAAYVAQPGLMLPVTLTMLKLSTQHGNSPIAAFTYAFYGVLLCGFMGDIELGYQFGQLSLKILEKYDARFLKSKVYALFYSMICPWKEPISATINGLLESIQSGLDTGDIEYAMYSLKDYCHYYFLTGAFLDDVNAKYEKYLALSRKIEYIHDDLAIWQQIGINLKNSHIGDVQITLENLNEAETFHSLKEKQYNIPLFSAYFAKCQLNYFKGDYAKAIENANEASTYLDFVIGKIYPTVHNFYLSLALLGLAQTLEPEERSGYLDLVRKNQSQLEIWANHAPMNILHKFYLVKAEICRVLGEKSEAIEYYDRAIALAKENGYIQEEALANELAAKFYLDWGKEKVANSYMQEAYYGYARWGAKAKITLLEQQYPQLLAAMLPPPSLPVTHEGTIAQTLMRSFTNVNSSQNLWLDVPAVIKAAQAISQEIELEKLLATLIQMAITSAGAQIGCLILRQDEQWLVVAQADSEQTHRLEILLEQCQEIPQSVIYAVARTQKTTVFENLSDSAQFAGDRYVTTHQPKSVLCTPISQQGKLIGILYLENNLTTGAFTSDRLQVIQLLTAQAAISLENAQLYCQLEEYSYSLEQKISERTQELTQKATQLESTLQELQRTQSQLIQAEKMSSLGQLVAGIAHEINNPINFIYGNLEPASQYVTSLIEINHLYQNNYPQPIPEIEEKIADVELYFLVNDLQKLFKSMKLGAERIRQIVLSLRNFSRLDESEIKPVDIHEGIDSTLLILQHRLKNSSKNAEISIIKEYSQMPLVNCYPSALNQVFMNILSNAIDALKELDVNQKPTITIRTQIQEQKYISIQIIDNGMGMSESVRNKIFEPFFTTKPVGSGTGLGLSISYSIVVEQHGGQLNCISAPGKGTEFIIKIPV
ncbi:GAF domain-containing protein [Nostoc sp. C052]|uniref:trifunctional serine/threonine-protein kinase/ATP-binding protein/sensor histidine kinase n=1 Tax=Nostoc sp. C052 TaxID=2576902 RepID=UPI0015C35F37|nr:ATP-binding sensor histidine kinase [Nostoc sp. C052]QLE44276.1 GAF domain-containing protein [Nostoc sp. C052]